MLSQRIKGSDLKIDNNYKLVQNYKVIIRGKNNRVKWDLKKTQLVDYQKEYRLLYM